MLGAPVETLTWGMWTAMLLSIGPIMFVATAAYNLLLHPLSHIPGPFWARASGIPSWYYAARGDRHIWLWQQFQIHGSKIRVAPNTVLFCDPAAYADIHGMKSNVRRSPFYSALRRKANEEATVTITDVAAHARRRKYLNICFTEKLIRTASLFIINHVDRWNQLLLGESDNNMEWSDTVDMSEKLDALVFDIMGELSFGRSFDIKEPGDNPLKVIPHCIVQYMQFHYTICHSPFLKLILWLKPRGLETVFDLITPPAVKKYNTFVEENISRRIALQKQQSQKPESERRQDIFYFLHNACDPDTGLPAFSEDQIRGESSLFIIAGSDTTGISLSGLFFYLTGDLWRLNKLVDEIISTFQSSEDIIHGPKLHGCTYLRACVDEGMRLTPSGPSEQPREVMHGGIMIKGEYFPAGTIVGTSTWANSRNQDVYGDPEVFRPERWIVDECNGVTAEYVASIKSNFYPFSSGPGNCVGKNLAMTEMLITVARTLYRLDIRRAPGSTFGAGNEKLGWGARDSKQMHVSDAFISVRRGPEVQFRTRVHGHKS